MQIGNLIFVEGKWYSPVDDAVKLGESILSHDIAKYSHVAVYIGNGQVAEAQGGRKSGVGELSAYTDDYDIGVIDMTSDQRGKLISVLQEEYNLPYDWRGIWYLILKILFGIDKHYIEHKRRYCSKFVECALKQVGITVDGTTPESLAHDPMIKCSKERRKFLWE